jgi:hypothetical protein
VKVFDCFLFYNEFDLLELRLRELYDHVDQFVIIESDHTLTNRPKPYFFEHHRSRYQPWLDKIRHVKHKSSLDSDPWVNVYEQRNALSAHIQDLDANDIVIFNDADEIVRHTLLAEMKSSSAIIFGLRMSLSNFKFNFIRTGSGSLDLWTTAARAGWVQKFGGQMLRNQLDNLLDLPFRSGTTIQPYEWWPQDVQIFQHGGWHFSYLGDDKYIVDKLQNTVHQEDNVTHVVNRISVERSILLGKSWNTSLPYDFAIVDLDSYFPKSCHLFPQHFLPNNGVSAQKVLNDHAT